MAKKEISYLEYAPVTLEALEHPGLLLVTQGEEGKPNIMTIGWAAMGNLWVCPCFIVLVRPSRHSYGLLEETGQFTVNVLPPDRANDAAYCGSVSGRDTDKFAECGLTAVPGRQVSVPIIGECVIHYECRVVHFNQVAPETMPNDFVETAYPGGDYHRLFFGEILTAYAETPAGEETE